MEKLIEYVLFQATYLELFLMSLTYFTALYFVLGYLFELSCKYLEKRKLVSKIVNQKVPFSQIKFEIQQSLKSLLIFGFSLLPVVYLIRIEIIYLLDNTFVNVLLGLLILNVWNEIHFYVVHKWMHNKWMMKNIHFVHHKTLIPTVYSVYSFHPLEALILSTVPICIMPLIPFSIIAVFLYPITSILFNFAGHCNYRIGNGEGSGWGMLATNHNFHHSKGKKNYGFALHFLDVLFTKNKKKI
jgi:sterol desaturase/sphingolipid hydroxylase (fatty acid hydroxylase superfamily)